MESPVEQSGGAPQQPKVSTVPGLAFSEVAGLCALSKGSLQIQVHGGRKLSSPSHSEFSEGDCEFCLSCPGLECPAC